MASVVHLFAGVVKLSWLKFELILRVQLEERTIVSTPETIQRWPRPPFVSRPAVTGQSWPPGSIPLVLCTAELGRCSGQGRAPCVSHNSCFSDVQGHTGVVVHTCHQSTGRLTQESHCRFEARPGYTVS